MNNILIGHTGLVGSTISKFVNFDCCFNSQNINDFDKYVENGDNLFLSCLSSNRMFVNKNITQDIENINNIIRTLSRKSYSQITLISTIDVYRNSPLGVTENYLPNLGQLDYGSNRYLFELMVKDMLKYDNLKIFRLGALFNNRIKKNILFDLLNNTKWDININSSFQWYNLDNIYLDIQKYSSKYPNKMIFNFFNEPISTKEITSLFSNISNNLIKGDNIIYDYKTGLSVSGYLYSKKEVLEDLKNFIKNYTKE